MYKTNWRTKNKSIILREKTGKSGLEKDGISTNIFHYFLLYVQNDLVVFIYKSLKSKPYTVWYQTNFSLEIQKLEVNELYLWHVVHYKTTNLHFVVQLCNWFN